VKSGDLITPHGVLVLDAETMRTDRAAWLAARRWREPDDGSEAVSNILFPAELHRHGYRIGSSDVPSILDLTGVGTPAHVWRNKVMGVEMPVTENMEWGVRFEPTIADAWTELYRSVTDEVGLIANAEKPWHQSTIDRRVRECPIDKGLRDGCGLEVKNVGYSTAERWGRDLPDRILAQVLHQMYVTGYPHMHVACNVGGNMLKPATVYANREADLMAFIVSEVDRFRDEHLLTGVEPEWNVMDKPAKMLELDRASHPVRAGEIGIDGIGDVMEYAQQSRIHGDSKKAMDRAKARLAQLADGARVVLFGDEPAYEYGEGSRTNVNVERLAEKYPDAYNDPEVVTETTYPILRLAPAYRIKPKRGE
jgi:YqaJ-like recombinase protein